MASLGKNTISNTKEVDKLVKATNSAGVAKAFWSNRGLWAFATIVFIIIVFILVYVFDPNCRNAVDGVLDDVGACGECSASISKSFEKL